MLRPTLRAVTILQVLVWLLVVGAGLQSSGCEVDPRVDVGTLNPGGAGGRPATVPCGAECPEVLCPADDVCRDYADRLPRGSCSPGGSCATVADCSPSWKPEAREGVACACDDTGCKLLPGEACTRGELCGSGSCSATDSGSNVCCNAACEPNEVCLPDGSACVAAAPCTDDNLRCSGAVQQHCAAGVWEPFTDCGVLGCSNERGGCLRSAGQPCEADADCGEGTCLATAGGSSVCCSAACGTSCRRCAASGAECEDIGDDAACGDLECPADVCRVYDPPSVTTDRCRAGQCKTPAEACTLFEPQRADLECNPTALCDDVGSCGRPKKDVLAACSSDSQCNSAACVANLEGISVCCGLACAANEVCSPAGSCVPAPVCQDGGVQCSGANFQTCSGGQWRTDVQCGDVACSVARSGCLSRPGDTCQSDTDCGAGRCQPTSGGESVCCTAACDGACRNCAPSGTACENLADDDACGAIACPADTTCRNFPVNVTSQRCVAGRCGSGEQLCVGSPRAAGQSCSDSNLCDGDGDCSVPKQGNGEACQAGAECLSNSCVQGVCCNTGPCQGTCFTCAGGVCRAPATDTRCSSGTCASPGVCEAPSVDCGSDTCVLADALCCSELNAAGATSVFCSPGATCPPPPNFVPDIPITCDEHADCPNDRVCCFSGTSTSGEVSCKLPRPSPGFGPDDLDFESCAPENPMLFGNQLCQAPDGTDFTCPSFEGCDSTNDRLPGFRFCRPD